MRKKNTLQFNCQRCKEPISFSVFDLDSHDGLISCSKCNRKYMFNDETLKRQLRKFEALCRQILDSEEILSHTSVGIDVGEHHIKVPYKLLLTRLTSTLDLTIGSEPISIAFRFEPLTDLPKGKNHE